MIPVLCPHFHIDKMLDESAQRLDLFTIMCEMGQEPGGRGESGARPAPKFVIAL
jgi:hypothetical protein